MPSSAEISGTGLDLNKGFFNQSVEVTLNGYANVSHDSDVYFALYNNNVELDDKIAAEWVTSNRDTNQFQAKYQIKLEDKSSIKLNLSAKIIANGQESKLCPLTLEQGRQTRSDEFLLENIPPVISDYQIGDEYWNFVGFNAKDDESGVSNVIVTVSDEKGNSKVFESDENKHYYPYRLEGFNGEVTVTITVTDKAGNTAKYISNKNVDGNKPEIDSISYQYKNEEDNWVEATSSVLHDYDYGLFANVPIRIVIRAHDTGDETTYSGIEIVKLFDDTYEIPNKFEKVMKTEEVELDDGTIKTQDTDEVEYYYFDIDSCKYNNLKVEVKDKAGNGTEEEIGQMVIETDSPNGEIDNPNFSSHIDANNTDWYGVDTQDERIIFKISDNQSGIASVVIKDGNTILNPNEKDFTKNNEIEYKKEYSFPIKTFKNGSHKLTVETVDNCGNSSSESVAFNTDFTRPDGEINFVTSPKIIEVDGEKQNWFNGCGAESEKVVFSLKISDVNPYKVFYSFVNSESQVVYKNELSYITDDGEKIYELEIDDDAAKIELEQNHYLDVCVTFVDQAGNKSTYDGEEGHREIAPIRFYKDLSYPKIDSVSVSKTETGLDKVLRVLTFGIYSNNNIKYTVKASDIEFDSGLTDDSVILAFGDSKYEMKHENANTYSFVLDASDKKIMSGEINVSVTDQYGLTVDRIVHYSEDFDVIQGTSEEPYFTSGLDNTKSRAFMIDKNLPVVAFNQLNSDGKERNDGTIWLK
ncbi:hypothetical protein, partial [Methanobrevibacter sp.]|uniref:hypothetical protein n=1 Tax=Methanobrevibacter sp. TaxID=66852 RepID=UPI00388D338E